MTELQRDANRRYGFSAKKTSNVLQSLYEQHKLVTYPRTDSRYLTTDLAGTMSERLSALSSVYKEEVRHARKHSGSVLAKRVFNNEKVTDHHAIIPTEERPSMNDLSVDEKKLYGLIATRFLTLFYPICRFESVRAVFDIEGEFFTVQETIAVDPGFKVILQGNDPTEASNSLAVLKPGKKISVRDAMLKENMTEAPPRFNESDLLARMEKYGLGTPATRADIIEKLLSSEVIDRQNNRLYPTPKGKQLIDLVNDELKSPELTSEWEAELEAIARGKGNPGEFLQKIRNQTKRIVTEIKQSEKNIKHIT